MIGEKFLYLRREIIKRQQYGDNQTRKEPEIRDILSMPIIGQLDADDINGDKARMEYYKEKKVTMHYSH